ncbi:MAG: family 3 adenylate cyclase [Acidobacteriota bacterium]
MSDVSLSPAALFDTRSEFARDLPVELIAAWLHGRQTAAAAREILAPYRVTGTAVLSDSAGLTRLARQREPLEVMALINRPKELVHEAGTAIGGQAMGVWTADNTAMFYPETIGGDRIAAMLLAVQDRIRAECEVQIGIGAHFDTCFLIGNALYGLAARTVECMAEDRTAGGEIVLTSAAWERVRNSAEPFQAVSRSEIACEFTDGFRLLDGPRLPWPERGIKRYPLPFSGDFYECLAGYDGHGSPDLPRRRAMERFARHCTVLLVERAPVEEETAESDILREMTRAAIARARGAWLLASTSGSEVKTAGSLSIYVFDEANEAWTFAAALRKALESEGIPTRSGLATGEVLMFELEDGGREISGCPVNMASKIAQDQGEFGRIYLVDAETGQGAPELKVSPVSFQVAGVEIPVWIG